MFDKERELVEIGPHSYNLKVGGEGGFEDSQQKIYRILANSALEVKYGENWRHTIALLGAKKRNQICQERCIGLFDPAVREMGIECAKSLSSIKKRIKTFQSIHHQQGSKNSQYGTMWITDGTANRKIKKEEAIPEGWIKGRSPIHCYEVK